MRGRRPSRSRFGLIPAPTGGWDTFSPLDGMPPNNAVRLDNFLPETLRVKIRGGHVSYATGVASSTASVETLMEYSGLTGRKLFAIASTAVYDVSSSGTASSSLTGLSNARWQHTVFTPNGGTPTLMMCNGVDTPRQYAGSAWSTVSVSVSSGSAGELIHVASHANRLWWTRKNSMSVFYSAQAGALSGQMTELNLGPIFDGGGYLIGTASWSRDSGDGPDNLAVFLTNNGEAAVYSGTDPGSANTWAHVQTYNLPRPIGQRPFMKFNGDLLVLTEAGVIPFSQVLSTGFVNPAEQGLSARIAKALNEAVKAGGDLFGWQACYYKRGTQILFNVPVKDGRTYHQYVVNTQNYAWCRYIGMNAVCWATYDNDLYFGGTDGTVYKADTGTSDNGAAIRGDIRTAFSRFGEPRKKHFHMIRPQITSDGSLMVAVGLNIDFADKSPSSIPTTASGDGATWDVSEWDQADWAGGEQVVTPWLNVQGIGQSASFALRVDVSDIEVGLNAVDVLYEPGEYL